MTAVEFLVVLLFLAVGCLGCMVLALLGRVQRQGKLIEVIIAKHNELSIAIGLFVNDLLTGKISFYLVDQGEPKAESTEPEEWWHKGEAPPWERS